MPVQFQEFLRQKAELAGVRERNRERHAWLDAIRWLLRQIQSWLQASDPEGLLDIIPYQVARVEAGLGIYDAPALKIRLGADEVDVVPVGRFDIGPVSVQALGSLAGLGSTIESFAGRVDITNGERRYLLLRDVSTGHDRWYALDEQARAALLDQDQLEAILQDLWS